MLDNGQHSMYMSCLSFPHCAGRDCLIEHLSGRVVERGGGEEEEREGSWWGTGRGSDLSGPSLPLLLL